MSEAGNPNSFNEIVSRKRAHAKSGYNAFQAQHFGKLPPQAIDLEESTLGALMLEKDALTKVIDILHPESFYKDSHRIIFSAIRKLFERSEPIDILTILR